MAIVTKYADNQTTVNVIRFDEDSLLSDLPPEVYSVAFDPMLGFFLNKEFHRFSVPSKVYGKTNHKVDKVVRGFLRSARSYGVLLSGDKGSGKTMQASLVANRIMNEMGLPVIMINGSFDGDNLVEFLDKIGSCVLFFDEFGKRFKLKENEQDSFLGLFDGTSSTTKRLIILTENDTRSISNFIIDRPGRMHYHFKHNKIEQDIVSEYCDEKGISKEKQDRILLLREQSFEFSFDSLRAIVQEINDYPEEDMDEIFESLNISTPIKFCDSAIVLSVTDMAKEEDLTVMSFSPEFPEKSHMEIRIKRNDGETRYIDIHSNEIVAREGDVYLFHSVGDTGTFAVKVKRLPPASYIPNLF